MQSMQATACSLPVMKCSLPVCRRCGCLAALWLWLGACCHFLLDATWVLQVAEMTGRKGRLVRSKSGTGVVYEARNASGVDAGAFPLRQPAPCTISRACNSMASCVAAQQSHSTHVPPAVPVTWPTVSAPAPPPTAPFALPLPPAPNTCLSPVPPPLLLQGPPWR